MERCKSLYVKSQEQSLNYQELEDFKISEIVARKADFKVPAIYNNIKRLNYKTFKNYLKANRLIR